MGNPLDVNGIDISHGAFTRGKLDSHVTEPTQMQQELFPNANLHSSGQITIGYDQSGRADISPLAVFTNDSEGNLVVKDVITPERMAKKIPVIEIFGPTIQGEGCVAGVQTMFIRFGLCDFKCTKCDSMHAVDPKIVKATAMWLTCVEIAKTILRSMDQNNCSHIKHITLSGGNPCIHDLGELVDLLHMAGKIVQVETQGTKHPEWLATCDYVVVSPKSPGMGEKFEPDVFESFMSSLYNPNLKPRLCVKIVIFSVLDLEFAAAVAELCKPYINLETDFYLSLGNPFPPVFEFDGTNVISHSEQKKELVKSLLDCYNHLSEELLKDPRLAFARFLPQLHVLVWGNDQGK